jgi:hypothetical protein
MQECWYASNLVSNETAVAILTWLFARMQLQRVSCKCCVHDDALVQLGGLLADGLKRRS